MSSPDVRAYLRERMRAGVVVPLTALTLLASLVLSDRMPDATGVVLSAISAALLVAAFRIWDDLEDRAYDRLHHPARVMSRATAITPFVQLALVLAGAAILLLALRESLLLRLTCVTAAAVLSLMWYRGRPAPTEHRLWGAHLVLAKYPLIACAVASEPNVRGVGALALGSLYIALCIHELLDDPGLRRRRSS